MVTSFANTEVFRFRHTSQAADDGRDCKKINDFIACCSSKTSGKKRRAKAIKQLIFLLAVRFDAIIFSPTVGIQR